MNSRIPFRFFTIPVLAGLLVLGNMSCLMLSRVDSGKTKPTTFEETWQQERDRLASKWVNCNSAVENGYKSCLQDAFHSGEQYSTAINSCAHWLENLPENDKGGIINIDDPKFYYRDTYNTFTLSYPSGGGYVEGTVNIVYDDTIMSPCKVEITYIFTGEYELATCRMSGTGAYESHSVGSGCLGTTDNRYQANWNALLQDGDLVGLVENSAISFNYHVGK